MMVEESPRIEDVVLNVLLRDNCVGLTEFLCDGNKEVLLCNGDAVFIALLCNGSEQLKLSLFLRDGRVL